MIRIALAGPRGKMGKEALELIQNTTDFELVGLLDSRETDALQNYSVFTSIDELFLQTKPDVFVDLTTPELAMKHTMTALHYGVRPVVGTTGFTEQDLKTLEKECKEKTLGCIIAPNFSIGAILMMKFAEQAAKYMGDVEIIEMHHNQKLDAPSGTALKTAELIGRHRPSHKQGHEDEQELLTGARGADIDGIKLHSVRLPGLVAHQQVLFGGEGQLLTLRHDSFTRGSFMPGVALSIREVLKRDTCIYGLENLIE
ncbi:4-hydroxy-tetrahydrodipicolinate reductase [Chryseomicrobium excrementi]|uniref:4-hydroxy-tetrahydrodipicolinate reductase n=1 Tax=Chryseomicrobium excrementi TaxID=2041346 RepID=A0A2M9F2S5_9BACL|nr:4-hydroxy-tetrahydrodipicolinate reductase [Chryseomicrobium excrementi]PJK17754.1 4-hydroxy-tetrahydrodipicolinate reductase [Chryseomicrobium excrementi]